MFYKLLHCFFGFDYIFWSNSADQGIARIFVSKDGKVCYWRYKVTSVLDIVYKPSQVLWLTCDSSKYFK